MDLAIDTVKAIYRRAIDEKASDGEGDAWWACVAVEVAAVVRATNAVAAASIIAWWHHDWCRVGDTPKAAATRIRRAAGDLWVCRSPRSPKERAAVSECVMKQGV